MLGMEHRRIVVNGLSHGNAYHGEGAKMPQIELMKNGGEKLIVERKLYRQSEVVSIRTWYLNHAEAKWFPTTRGISMSLRNWQAVMPNLLQMLETVDKTSDVETRSRQAPAPIQGEQKKKSSQ